jgi:hypothetical protein
VLCPLQQLQDIAKLQAPRSIRPLMVTSLQISRDQQNAHAAIPPLGSPRPSGPAVRFGPDIGLSIMPWNPSPDRVGHYGTLWGPGGTELSLEQLIELCLVGEMTLRLLAMASMITR